MANRLQGSTSPYLLQHAHNPVDWWPWGEEAFAEARRRDVPIFLSIGYSTCYWCHVMERESFEDAETASLMNERFVCIKLDREEHPEIDDLYMAATVMLTGRGGWPMSVFLEPQHLRPFMAGTYFPKEPRAGMSTFSQVLLAMSGAWRMQREGVMKQAEEVARAVEEHLARPARAAELGQKQVADAVSGLLRTLDKAEGGFGAAPKFPQAVYLEFLLDVRVRAGDDATADAVDFALRKTLDRMAVGGLHDQPGGGFHRYCVDGTWTVPHFEKMLYDQAQLLRVYARAAKLYTDPYYAHVARRTAECVLRDMTSPQGAFLSAIDAEVDGREGVNYLWTPTEVAGAVGEDDAPLARAVYGLAGPANFRDPHHPADAPAWVLRLSDRPELLAPGLRRSQAAFTDDLARINRALLARRDARPQPRKDDKVLAGWNGMMISALMSASEDLNEPRYATAAKRAAEFVRDHMISAGGTLVRSSRAGLASSPGVLEDYGAVVSAFVALRGLSPDWLHAAKALASRAMREFADASGVLHDAPAGRSDLFVRGRSTHDGACPSGVSLMLHALLDLREATGDRAYSSLAVAAISGVSEPMTESPTGSVNSVRALLRLLLAAEVNPGEFDPGESATAADQGVVEVLSETDRVLIPVGGPALLNLAMRVAPGWHIVSAEPGDTPAARAMFPLRVGVVGGTGVRAFADYPPGTPMGEGDARVLVHGGQTEFKVVLEREGEWTGRPLLTVAYQACTDRECRKPAVVELDIALDPA
ncbi:MAG: thioredoxin domain-containing protein [Phycisphaerales bacterium]|nr:thioredoxin domain-containing protein [Phycisphaerales bacterium]